MQEDIKCQIEQLQKQIQKLEEERGSLTKFYSENRKWIRFFSISFIMAGLVVHATVPNVFTANTVISASQMNQNFNYLESLAQGGATVAVIQSTTPKTFISSSTEMIYDGTYYSLRNYFLQATTMQSDGNVSDLGSNLATAYTVPVDGWYEIFIEGNLSVAVDPGNIVHENNMHISVAPRVGQVSGGVFVSKDWLESASANLNIYDANTNTTIETNDPNEYSESSYYGRSSKYFLKAGQSVGVALEGSLKYAGDSIRLNSFKLTIKKLTL